MAATNFLGVGSGLPFDQWLADERKGISMKLNPYLQKQSNYKGQISAWGSISSTLSTLKDNLGKLQDEGFNGVSVSDNKTFKATAASGAIPNSYQISVKQLAQAHQVNSAEQGKRDKQIGNSDATVKITLGDSDKPLEIKLKKDETSLDQVAKKINAQNGDVIAEVIPVKDGKFKLVLTSKKTGEEGKMTVKVEGNSDLASALDFDPASPPATPDPTKVSQMTAAKNAVILLNGDEIERSSNTISDVIGGITLELREVSETDPSDPDKLKTETLAVTADTSKVKTLIEEFVKNYNSYLSTVASATKYTAPDRDANSDSLAQPDPTNGALFSDGSLRRLTSQLKSTVTGSYPEVNDVLQSLGSIGITVKFDGEVGDDRSGTLGALSIDTKKLDAALKDNPKEVEALFLGKGGSEGLKDRLEGVFDTYLGDKDSVDNKEGSIASSLKTLREQDSRVAKQITAMEKRIEETMLRREKEYQRLDKAMSDMNSMSSQLTSALAGLINN